MTIVSIILGGPGLLASARNHLITLCTNVIYAPRRRLRSWDHVVKIGEGPESEEGSERLGGLDP